jgi:hypothetical protein
MLKDVYSALENLGERYAHSDNLGTKVCEITLKYAPGIHAPAPPKTVEL